MKENKKDTLKDWVKNWSITSIVQSIGSEGMSFMANKISDIEYAEHQRIMIAEINRRIRNL